MIQLVTVHTTGINVQGLLTNVASIVIIVGAMLAYVVKTVKTSIREQIEYVIKHDIKPVLDEIQATLISHDTRIAHLEGVEEGKKYAVAAAGVTTKSTASTRK
jgi:hypothetical protein